MNTINRTDINTHKQSQKMTFCVAGMALFLLTTFPQTLWASNENRIDIGRVLEVLELVLGDRSAGSYRNSFTEGRQYYRGNEGYREYRPVANRDYREDRRSGYYNEHRGSGYYRNHPRKHRHPKHKHCHKNKHRHSHHDHDSWR